MPYTVNQLKYSSYYSFQSQIQTKTMQKNRPNASKIGQSRSKNTIKNKQNPLSDTIYLIQNENEVLRMKNSQLNERIRELKAQLQQHTDNIVMTELEINGIKKDIGITTFTEDIEIQNQKKLVLEKLTIIRSSEDMILRKIQEAREVAIFEEQKIQNISHDKKSLQIEVLSLRAQNEGTKIILRNLQDQNERLREDNEKLVNRRKIFEPKQRELSLQIEERIRLIKNQRNNLKNLRLYETSKFIQKLLTIIYKKKMKEHLIKIDRSGLLKKLAKKKIMQLSLIRKKYISFVKNRVLQIFRQSFKPLKEYQTAKRIIADTQKRRVKFIIWRKWRKTSIQSVYTKTRRFQIYNLFCKLEQSFSKTLLYSAFNQIRYLKFKPLRQRGAMLIENTFNVFTKRFKSFFMCNLKIAQKKYEMDLQIDASSKQQSQLLLSSLYFSAWAKIAIASRIQNKNLKRRYFKQLKKLLTLKKKRVLSEMLMKTNLKIKSVELSSKIFNEMKRQGKIQSNQLNEELHSSLIEKNQSLKQENQALHSQKKALYQELALIKISKYLKRKTQKAFDVWRLRKQQAKILMNIINLVQNKKTFDKNFAFSKILKKRFAMLKKSIRDKIQSCEFSYNYLLDENKHIKEVLDKKQHELQKTKFVKLLQNIMKNEKQAKFKYFYKFLKNGYKYWKFRKTVERVDLMTNKKLKMVFMWLLKQNINTIKAQEKLEEIILQKEQKIIRKIYKKTFKGFQECIKKNRRIRVVLRGIFDRNLELDYFTAYGKIRNEQHLQNRGQIQQNINLVNQQVDKMNAIAAEQQNKTNVLLERLQDKEETLRERKILGLYKFFSKFIKIKFSSYIQKWHKRVKRQNNVVQFAQILQRKSSVLLKTKFLLTMNRKNEEYTVTEIQNKFTRFKKQYDEGVLNQEKYVKESDIESKRMKAQNETNKKQGDIYEKKTNHMVNVQIKSYNKAANKRLVGYCFKEWAKQKEVFRQTWTKLNRYYELKQIKEVFPTFIREMEYEVHQFNMRRKLEKMYYKHHYLFNIRVGFNSWRFTNLDKTNKLWLQEQKEMKKRFEGLENKYKLAIRRHDEQFKFRVFDKKTRTVFNYWRIYSQKRAKCRRDEEKFDAIMKKAYSGEIIRLLKAKVNKKIQFQRRLNNFKNKWIKVRMLAFFSYTLKMKKFKTTFKHIFVDKYCPYLVYRTKEEFLSRVKNFINTAEINLRTKNTDNIQKVIQTFEKKRKDILNLYLRKWRRNEYVMRIQFNLMRRVTKNAMNYRVKDLFYAWKLQKQAKNVKIMHEQEGQVKKRKIQINRLKIFLQDFKKQKGLLLQNQGGEMVVSPRFQEKKQQQIKKDNNLRYRFISRLILSMNGYSAPVKSYNNLRLYMQLRQKYKKFALVIKNKLRKPDLYYGFKIWQNASKKFNNMFQVIERKLLIKILNKQKDKMEMQYSKKISLIEKINEEMKVHKLLSHQDQRKQKLCVHVYLKNLRKIKTYALLTWKKRVEEMKEAELIQLQDHGSNKINSIEQQVKELQQMQRQMRNTNQKLQRAVHQALEIAEMVKRITEERDILSNGIRQKELTCQSLQQQNEQLNAKLYLAQKEAMNLLILSGERL